MNEVDRLYNEWIEGRRRKVDVFCSKYRIQNNSGWHVNDPEYIRARTILKTNEQLNKFLEDNKYDLCSDETAACIKYAKEELKRRADKYSELVATVRNDQLETRKETFLEQAAEQNEPNSSGLALATLPFGGRTETKTIRTEGKNTMEKTVNVNTKIDIATLIQAKMAEKMMDAVGDGKDIPLTKLTIMQSLANGGSIDVTELIRVKQTEKLLKDLNENKDLSIGKLLTYQALTGEGGFDVNALIQAQFIEKLFADDEKEK